MRRYGGGDARVARRAARESDLYRMKLTLGRPSGNRANPGLTDKTALRFPDSRLWQFKICRSHRIAQSNLNASSPRPSPAGSGGEGGRRPGEGARESPFLRPQYFFIRSKTCVAAGRQTAANIRKTGRTQPECSATDFQKRRAPNAGRRTSKARRTAVVSPRVAQATSLCRRPTWPPGPSAFNVSVNAKLIHLFTHE